MMPITDVPIGQSSAAMYTNPTTPALLTRGFAVGLAHSLTTLCARNTAVGVHCDDDVFALIAVFGGDGLDVRRVVLHCLGDAAADAEERDGLGFVAGILEVGGR